MGRKPKQPAQQNQSWQPNKTKTSFIKGKKDDAKKEVKIRQPKEIARLRGMRDVLPDEYRYWDYVVGKAEKICRD
ncbi:hypothetical protein COT95_00830, partial [Candidatus Falkowbacteria bacterium CG10_big_fil_rev_8_21_14_0_10_37_6]